MCRPVMRLTRPRMAHGFFFYPHPWRNVAMDFELLELAFHRSPCPDRSWSILWLRNDDDCSHDRATTVAMKHTGGWLSVCKSFPFFFCCCICVLPLAIFFAQWSVTNRVERRGACSGSVDSAPILIACRLAFSPTSRQLAMGFAIITTTPLNAVAATIWLSRALQPDRRVLRTPTTTTRPGRDANRDNAAWTRSSCTKLAART